MSGDALGILGRHGVCAADRVAEALRPKDPQTAAIVAAQADWLREGSEASRARAASLIDDLSRPSDPKARRHQILYADLFEDNLTRLGPGDADLVWVYDDDVVSLEADGWEGNTAADQALRGLLASDRRAGVLGIRLLVFEGTVRLAATLRDHGAAHLVSHLDLRLQRAYDGGPVARSFPALEGLCCDADELAAVMAEALPSLRSLIVRGPAPARAVLKASGHAPGLRHLGVWRAGWDETEMEAFLASPRLAGLRSLDLYDVHPVRPYPFAAVLAGRSAWQHLAFVGLPGHMVVGEVRAPFDPWPQVTFVSYDRREVIALDFETVGWGRDAR